MGTDANFKTLESLDNVKRVLAEAQATLGDTTRTIDTSSIPDVLHAVTGMGVGAVGSFAALYGLGTVGLSAAGITSGLAAAGAIAGGGMAAGVLVLAAPVAVLGVIGYAIAAKKKQKKLMQAKEELLRKAVQMRDGIIQQLKKEVDAAKDRLDHLNSLNVLLQTLVRDLQADLAG